MHLITVTTNTASGGDSTSISATEGPDGWNFEVSDSCGLDFALPADTLKELPDEDGLIKFIDAVRLEGEPSFKGLVFGFLEMNFPSDRKLNDGEVLSAKKFLEIESGSFPGLVKKYEKAIEDWLKEHS
jgi:hypothetical protein